MSEPVFAPRMIKCDACGKVRCAEYPTLWAYKRGHLWFCSWKCLEAHEAQMVENRKQRRIKAQLSNSGKAWQRKITVEAQEKAIQIAMEDGDVMAYLDGLVDHNVYLTWYRIRDALEKKRPEVYARLPERYKIRRNGGK
ncbi:MAG: hypothetical protein J6P40_07275 [Oscillospiraceae bacterium]|nr:hypothetical protein [Oscillospiraceae bacterium]